MGQANPQQKRPDQKVSETDPEGPVTSRIAGRYVPVKPPSTRDGRKKATP